MPTTFNSVLDTVPLAVLFSISVKGRQEHFRRVFRYNYAQNCSCGAQAGPLELWRSSQGSTSPPEAFGMTAWSGPWH